MSFIGQQAYDPMAEQDVAADIGGCTLEADASGDTVTVSPQVQFVGQTAALVL